MIRYCSLMLAAGACWMVPLSLPAEPAAPVSRPATVAIWV